jgi:C1A family cysteine protease
MLASVLLNTSIYDPSNAWAYFVEYQTKFHKQYSEGRERDSRFVTFCENLETILAHNRNPCRTFTMGINAFTDMPPAEFKARFASGYVQSTSTECFPFVPASDILLDSLDWRTEGVVNDVRDQGQCGSCWAFASTANAESAWAISTHELMDLSEQYLVDCAKGRGYWNLGCNGGMPDSAFQYLIEKGACEEDGYPYVSGITQTEGTCHECSPSKATFSACYDIEPANQASLKAAVSMQPVVVAIEADSRYFQSYAGGILTDSLLCGTKLDHAVEIVGYGEENGIPYWTVRNSWGDTWGENGYVRIQRSDSVHDAGVCGIAVEPSFIQV